jgi:ubiquinone/menaquinone biosynthesis C-methylase UbiE
MPLEQLPPVAIAGHRSSGLGHPEHPMRVVTRQVAGLDVGGWTEDTRRDVARYFDELAAEWQTRTSPERLAVVVDAIERGLGGVPKQSTVVEIGSGTGAYSALFAKRFARVVAVDLSFEMLRQAPVAPAFRVQADAFALPLDDASVDAVLLVNAFLFPAEVARVLRPHGAVLWVNSSGEQTPIHLSTDELVAALPGSWTGVWSRAGEGLWCVVNRE